MYENDKYLMVGHRSVRGSMGEMLSAGDIACYKMPLGKLIEKRSLLDPSWGSSHFEISGNNRIAISTQHFFDLEKTTPTPDSYEEYVLPTPLALGQIGENKWEYIMPNELKNHMKMGHSIKIDNNRGCFLVVHQNGDLVTRWDLKTGALLSKVNIQRPHGLEISKKGDFYIVSTKESSIFLISAIDFSIEHIQKSLLPKFENGPDHIGII